jgi:hypothetical protein
MTVSADPTASPHQPAAAVPAWKIKLLYDGDCPLCLREVNFLRKKDNGRGLVAFADIAADDYSPDDNGGVDFATAMGRIHAVKADGTVRRPGHWLDLRPHPMAYPRPPGGLGLRVMGELAAGDDRTAQLEDHSGGARGTADRMWRSLRALGGLPNGFRCHISGKLLYQWEIIE